MTISLIHASLVDQIASDVHDEWMAGQTAAGNTSRTSTLTGAELMVPYAELADADREVDRATVRTVVDGLSRRGLLGVSGTGGDD